MTTIAIIPADPGSASTDYLAIAGKIQCTGKTPGQALDALTERLDESQRGTLLVVQKLAPDSFFNADQRKRLEDLMARWRAARDQGTRLATADQAELDALVEAELEATARRGAALELRRAWMTSMGLGADEIEESLADEPPVSVDEELKQLRALSVLAEITPSAQELGKSCS